MKYILVFTLVLGLGGCVVQSGPMGNDRSAEVTQIAPPHPGQPCNVLCDHHYFIGYWYRSCSRHGGAGCGHEYNKEMQGGVWTLRD